MQKRNSYILAFQLWTEFLFIFQDIIKKFFGNGQGNDSFLKSFLSLANIILAFVTPNCSMSFQELLMIHRQGIILFLRCLVLSVGTVNGFPRSLHTAAGLRPQPNPIERDQLITGQFRHLRATAAAVNTTEYSTLCLTLCFQTSSLFY